MLVIKEVKINPKTKYKLFQKHGVRFEEVKEILLNKFNPAYVQRVKDDTYMVISLGKRYLTIFFKYYKKRVTIKSAYPSEKWQIQLYKRKVRK